MEKILFLNGKRAQGSVKSLSAHTIEILTDVPVNTSGFRLVNDKGDAYGKYDDYTTLYKEIDGGFILSNDGSVYREPESWPDPGEMPYEPTLEELREAKVTEMNTEQQKAIRAGLDVTLTDGTVEHFSLSEHDQTSLMGLQAQVMAGQEDIPWHTSDETEHCKFYSNADMKTITGMAMSYVTWHVTYFRDLRIYIRSLQSKEEVEAVTYGMELPLEFQSEPQKAMIAAWQS